MKLVIQNGSRVWGGNEKWLATLGAGLMARGHEVVVACPRGAVSEGLARLRIPSADVRPGGTLDLPGALRFARWLRRERADALLLTSCGRTRSAAAGRAPFAGGSTR